MKYKQKPQYIAVGIDGDGIGTGDTPDKAVENLKDKVLNLWDGTFILDEVTVFEVKRMGGARITIEWVTE